MALLALAALAPAAFPQEAERRVAVQLVEGDAPYRFEDSISDFEAVSYVVPLRQGQSLHVMLASSNASNCFDVYAPNAAKPLYVGSDSGNVHELQAKISGDYVVKVFLLRFAARDGQSARYTLELKVTG
jgi:hypothetical protein